MNYKLMQKFKLTCAYPKGKLEERIGLQGTCSAGKGKL